MEREDGQAGVTIGENRADGRKESGGHWLNRVVLNVVALAAQATIRFLGRTVRLEYEDRHYIDGLIEKGRPFILAFWHGRMIMMPHGYFGQQIKILISQHRDGEYISRTMEWLGYGAIRGSTTSGGSQALRQTVRALQNGQDVAFTPDGPRGPRGTVQLGVIQAARLASAPIVPISFSASRGRFFQSWDAFFLPYPFSRGKFAYGEPITVPSDADAETMEKKRRALEEHMRQLTERLDRELFHR